MYLPKLFEINHEYRFKNEKKCKQLPKIHKMSIKLSNFVQKLPKIS